MGANYLEWIRSYCRTLEESVGRLPESVRSAVYRPCGIACVQDTVLREMRRQFEECGRSLDAQYAKYGRSEYFFADIVKPGRIYELDYPRCLCPAVIEGFAATPTHCECSRQSILHVLQEPMPEHTFRVEIRNTVLSGSDRCLFRVTADPAE